MAEQTKKRSMTADIKNKGKEKKQIQRSDEGKQSKKESDPQRRHCGFMGSVVPQLPLTDSRCRQREQN